MNKRVASKVLFDFSAGREYRASSVKAAAARIGRWAQPRQVVAPLHGDVFMVVSFMCKNWLRLLRGAKPDGRCVPKYQRESAHTVAEQEVGSEYANRRSLVVAYRRTGDFDRFGAELLTFDHVVGDLALVGEHYGIAWEGAK